MVKSNILKLCELIVFIIPGISVWHDLCRITQFISARRDERRNYWINVSVEQGRWREELSKLFQQSVKSCLCCISFGGNRDMNTYIYVEWRCYLLFCLTRPPWILQCEEGSVWGGLPTYSLLKRSDSMTRNYNKQKGLGLYWMFAGMFSPLCIG